MNRGTHRPFTAGHGRGSLGVPGPSESPRKECSMADKSPKKNSAKTAASKSLKEKRAEKKAKTARKD